MDSTRNVASHCKKVKKRNRARVLSNEDDTCCLKLMNYFTWTLGKGIVKDECCQPEKTTKKFHNAC